MNTLTYSLRDGQTRSDRYYAEIAAFTDQVLDEAHARLAALMNAFQTDQETLTGPQTEAESTLELLTLGTLWRVYAGDALGLAPAPRQVLTGLSRLRQRGGWVKAVVDVLRGLLSTLFLHPARRAPISSPTLTHLEQLLNWLAATGDFEQEVKRLRPWQAFLEQRAEQAAADLTAILALAEWFEIKSVTALGRYTPNVERFLTETHPGYRWREDAIFCGRRRVEYHLNMVGTEILNRVFRQEFMTTTRKLVLAPPCMKAKSDDQCEARSTSLGARCLGCTPGCHVHQLTKLGEKHGFGVLILPDDLRVFSSGGMSLRGSEQIGIVGVACALTNASGGWQTKGLGVPAQGLLLDYCGCRYHWHKDGLPTDVNFHQLLNLLKNDANPNAPEKGPANRPIH